VCRQRDDETTVTTDDHQESKRAPHGFALPPDEHKLLRGRPSAGALAWAVRPFGSQARVVAVRALRGGRSSAVHAVTIDDGRCRHRVVLRRYVRPDMRAEEPDLVRREADTLRLLETTAVLAPRLIAVDPTGHEAGVPAVLMGRLAGGIDWEPANLDQYLLRLAEPLPTIHAVPVPGGTVLPPYQPYERGRELGPPPWTRFPRAWARAIELYEGPPPHTDRVFVHRDFHPGNVLWRRRRVSGIVDWQSASVGAPEVDVGHCRSNLVDHFSVPVADRFLAMWQTLSGRTDYHPYWDVAVVVGPPDGYGDPDPRLDEWVAATVART
jgi:aminoglycoside phosphotransferase (APT) family kinase protein